MDFPFALMPQQPLITNEIHVIESDSDSEHDDAPPETTAGVECLEDAIEAWQEIQSLVRNIGSCVLKREIEALKRKASEISPTAIKCDKTAEENPRGGPGKDHMPSQTSPCKRRRVSGFEQGKNHPKQIRCKNEEEAILRRRMERMKRMSTLLTTIQKSHKQLESELEGMLLESQLES